MLRLHRPIHSSTACPHAWPALALPSLTGHFSGLLFLTPRNNIGTPCQKQSNKNRITKRTQPHVILPFLAAFEVNIPPAEIRYYLEGTMVECTGL